MTIYGLRLGMTPSQAVEAMARNGFVLASSDRGVTDPELSI